ncbi:metallophosphoesterase [Deinococcus sp.]|uniref:metallophosphoesterase n=1 Tax=Deinococcus sp. TaxID=47478 RepID=UPI003C7C3048
MPLPPDHRELPGPFDLIGDVHDCLPELLSLLSGVGYAVNEELEVVRPAGRTLVFLGDLTDRGPDSPGVLRLVMSTVAPRYAWGQPRRQAAARLARSRGQGRARFRALVIQTPYVFMTECSVPDTFNFLLSWREEMSPHAEGVDQQNGWQTLPSCLFAANAVPTANPVLGRVQRRAARPTFLDTEICRPGGHITQVVRY